MEESINQWAYFKVSARWSPSSWFWAKRRNWRKSSNLRNQSLKSTKPPASRYGASERRWQTTANNRQLVGLFSAPLSRETFESIPWYPSVRVSWSCNTGCLRQWMVISPLSDPLSPKICRKEVTVPQLACNKTWGYKITQVKKYFLMLVIICRVRVQTVRCVSSLITL